MSNPIPFEMWFTSTNVKTPNEFRTLVVPRFHVVREVLSSSLLIIILESPLRGFVLKLYGVCLMGN
jgi:hypothetical protein